MSKETHRESASGEQRYWLKISNVCNNRCLFCLDEDGRRSARFEPLAGLGQEIRLGISRGARRLVVSGGEPTIHPQFTRILEMGREAGFPKIQVISNGRMFSYMSFAREALGAGLSEVTFSIHGHTPALHDHLTGVKGAFEQALRGISNLRSGGRCVISIDIVVNRLNYKYITKIMHLFMAQGIFEFDLLNLIPFGAARRNWQQLSLEYEKALPFLQKAFACNNDKRCFVWSNRFPAGMLEGNEELIQSPTKLYEEVLGRADSFTMYLEKGAFHCQGEFCKDCFIEDFCNQFRFYVNPVNPGMIKTGTTGKKLTNYLKGCLYPPAFLRTVLTAQNLHYICMQAPAEIPALPGAVIFEAGADAPDLMAEWVLPVSLVCYLEFDSPDPVCIDPAFYQAGIRILFVLNRATQVFLLKNQAAFSKISRPLYFRLPVYENLPDARREYRQLHKVLELFPTVPVFGATPCLCRYSLPEAEPVLDLQLVPGNSRKQLSALVKDYIQNRYRVKSTRCRQCRADLSCRGMPVNYIRCFGFKQLDPLVTPSAAEAPNG